jgi:hypothetical protein
MDNVPLTTGAWITLRVTHNSTAPTTARDLFLAEMKEKGRVACRVSGTTLTPIGTKWVHDQAALGYHTARYQILGDLSVLIDLLYLSAKLLRWQAVAAIIGGTSSNMLRHNSRCTWRHREGSRHVDHTAIRHANSPLRPGGSVPADVYGCPEARHRSGPLSRSGTPRGRTREKKRPHRLTMPRDALPTRPSSFRLLAMASPH